MPKSLSNSLTEENYLKFIYHYSQQLPGRVPTSAIAAGMEISAASVTEKLQRMANKGLIDYEKSRGVLLTADGMRIAVRVVRKHRVWETFLVNKLHFRWDEVHSIAEQLEHIDSDVLVDRIDALLDFPKFDPHGEPIPDSRGIVSPSCFKILSEMNSGNSCRITGVKEDSPLFLKLFEDLGLTIGARIFIESIEVFDHSLSVICDERLHIRISKEVATNVLVTSNERCCAFEPRSFQCPATMS
jgi:DtxR family transcriptional regulator, Mn-dependent transcriptional regulator